MQLLHAAFVPGAPGGPELLVLLFILMLFAVPLVGIAIVVWVLTRDRDGNGDRSAAAPSEPTPVEQRVAALERRVERLEAEREDE